MPKNKGKYLGDEKRLSNWGLNKRPTMAAGIEPIIIYLKSLIKRRQLAAK